MSKMGRQRKLTDNYTQKKSAVDVSPEVAKKLPVKRKLLTDENVIKELKEACAFAPPVEIQDPFLLAKTALHTSRPSQLIAREEQLSIVLDWLSTHIDERLPGSLYISGAPGTGKTAVVTHSIDCCEKTQAQKSKTSKSNFRHLFVNCMTVGAPANIYREIATALGVSPKIKPNQIKEHITKKLLSPSKVMKMTVLVLDEVDQLLQGSSKENDVLYSLFEWARSPGSKLIMIGIANALDLTVRHLPLLSSSIVSKSPAPSSKSTKKSKKSEEKPVDTSVKVLNFPPYERADIEKILEARLMEIGSDIFDVGAIKFVAAKVAATTGDMRKALNGCKSAMDAVEKQQRLVLKSTADDGFNFSSPKKCCIISDKINVATVAKVFGPQKDEGPLPLQQMIILATLLRIYKAAPNSRQPKSDGVNAPVPLTTMYDEYRKICSQKGFPWIERSEITAICSMLQDRSLTTVVENMSGGTTKKFGTLNSKNKTGFYLNVSAVEKIVMQGEGDLKSIVLVL